MIELLKIAAQQCYNDWQLRCNLRGCFDLRLPMFQEMMIKLQELEGNNIVSDFLRENNAIEQMEIALQDEFQRRYRSVS